MSDQPSPSKQGANVPEKKADKKPEDTPTPEQQTQHPVAALTLLLVNPNKHHENEMSKIHVTMLDLWEQEKAAEAEQLALLLLSYSTLPIPYRAFAHMVLAYGEFQPLFHAQKMVEAAQEDIAKYGADDDAASDLLQLAQETLAEVEADLSGARREAEPEGKDVDEGPMISRDKDADGSEDEGSEHQ